MQLAARSPSPPLPSPERVIMRSAREHVRACVRACVRARPRERAAACLAAVLKN
jgi:hypothetical protein